MKFGTKATALAIAIVLVIISGCADIEQRTGIGTGAQTGAAVGAAAGGLIAAAAGANTGWVIASAVLGAVAGGFIGDYLTEEDKVMVGETTHETLEKEPDGTSNTWQNPNSGNSGNVTVNETYFQDDGTPCRRFTQTINAGDETESGKGTACRAADGTWQISS